MVAVAELRSSTNCETDYTRPRSFLGLVNGNAAIKKAAAVVVTVVERDAEQRWRRQRTVRSHNREHDRPAVVGPRPGEGHGMRNRIKGGGCDLRGLEVNA